MTILISPAPTRSKARSVAPNIWFRDVIDVTVIAAGLSLVPSFGLVYLIAGGKSSIRFIASVLGGLIGFVIGVIVLGIEPTIAITTLVGALIGLAIDKKKPSVEEPILQTLS